MIPTVRAVLAGQIPTRVVPMIQRFLAIRDAIDPIIPVICDPADLAPGCDGHESQH